MANITISPSAVLSWASRGQNSFHQGCHHAGINISHPRDLRSSSVPRLVSKGKDCMNSKWIAFVFLVQTLGILFETQPRRVCCCNCAFQGNPIPNGSQRKPLRHNNYESPLNWSLQRGNVYVHYVLVVGACHRANDPSLTLAIIQSIKDQKSSWNISYFAKDVCKGWFYIAILVPRRVSIPLSCSLHCSILNLGPGFSPNGRETRNGLGEK